MHLAGVSGKDARYVLSNTFQCPVRRLLREVIVHRSSFGLVLIAVLSACSTPAGPSVRGVQVTLTKSLYAPGEVITGELVNGSEHELGYGACSLHVQRLAATRWVFVGPQPAPCIDILYVLDRRSRAIQLQITWSQDTASHCSPGTSYRQLRLLRVPRGAS